MVNNNNDDVPPQPTTLPRTCYNQTPPNRCSGNMSEHNYSTIIKGNQEYLSYISLLSSIIHHNTNHNINNTNTLIQKNLIKTIRSKVLIAFLAKILIAKIVLVRFLLMILQIILLISSSPKKRERRKSREILLTKCLLIILKIHKKLTIFIKSKIIECCHRNKKKALININCRKTIVIINNGKNKNKIFFKNMIIKNKFQL